MVKVKMKRNQIGRQGVKGYKSEMFKKGEAYEITDELAKAFLKTGAAEKTRGKVVEKVEPEKEEKMDGPKENK